MTAPVQFSVWLRDAAGDDWGGTVYDADGSPDYSRQVTVDVPIGNDYHVYVYYRATSGDPWSVYGIAPGTVNVVQAINVTARHRHRRRPRHRPHGRLDAGYAHDCAGAVQRLAAGRRRRLLGRHRLQRRRVSGLLASGHRRCAPSPTTTTSTSTTAPPAASPGACYGIAPGTVNVVP